MKISVFRLKENLENFTGGTKTLIFTQTKATADFVERKLRYERYDLLSITSLADAIYLICHLLPLSVNLRYTHIPFLPILVHLCLPF